MKVKYKGREVDNYTNELCLDYKIITHFSPYDEEECSSIGRWFKESAVMRHNKVLAEVAVRACVPDCKLLISRDDPNIRIDKCKCIRHVKYMRDECPDAIVEISFEEQPEFYIESVKIAVVPGGKILRNKLRMLDTGGEVVLIDNFPICLYEAKKDYARERPDLPIMADAAGWYDAIQRIVGWIVNYSYTYYK